MTEEVRPAEAPARTHAGIDNGAARAADRVLSLLDNLEMIEGIGPSITHLQRSSGVNTFVELAGMTLAGLLALLQVLLER